MQSGELQNIDPEAIGLLGPEQGGLGAALWKGTQRETVERLMPTVSLPTSSPALNNLARRFLLTTANVPEGASIAPPQSLVSMRVERLVALGDTADAWRLASAAKPDQIDEITLRLTAEAALVGSESKNVCDKLPTIIQTHNSPEWQEPLIVCQLRANDIKGAQLGLELLHAQNVHDDTFFTLAEHNIIGGSKSLPRQLTPLKPLILALLRLVDQPLSGEVYAHPDAALIPELLQATPRDDNMRLALAERASSRGLIAAAQLAYIYRAVSFTPDRLAAPLTAAEAGPRLRALLYQSALAEKIPMQRVGEAMRFLQNTDPVLLDGAIAQVLAEMVDTVEPTEELRSFAAPIAEIYILAGKPEPALKWLKFAREQASAKLDIIPQLQAFWPLVALANLDTDSDYSKNFSLWIAATLKDGDRARREQVGQILLLLDAAGFAVPDDAWAHVEDISTVSTDKHVIMPSAVLLERLRAAGAGNKRGAAVLLGLISVGNDTLVFLTVVETVRALRLVGLNADASALARETATTLLLPPVKP